MHHSILDSQDCFELQRLQETSLSCLVLGLSWQDYTACVLYSVESSLITILTWLLKNEKIESQILNMCYRLKIVTKENFCSFVVKNSSILPYPQPTCMIISPVICWWIFPMIFACMQQRQAKLLVSLWICPLVWKTEARKLVHRIYLDLLYI